MKKRSQITIFIILGVAIIGVFIIIGAIMAKKRDKVVDTQDSIINLETRRESVDIFVTSALEGLVQEAKSECGLVDTSCYERYIDQGIKDVDIKFMESGGYLLYAGVARSKVELTDDGVTVALDWPLKLVKGDAEIELNQFQHTFPTAIDITVPVEGDIDTGTATSSDTVGFSSTDDEMKLTIRRGTTVQPGCENPSIKIIDQPSDPDNTEVNICKVSYELLPKNCRWDIPVQVHFTYPDSDKSKTTAGRTDEITLGVQDESTGKWYVVPCFTDRSKEIIECEFSMFGKVSCIEANEGYIDTSTYEVKDYCPMFYPGLKDSPDMPCICGNNVIYRIPQGDDPVCVPDTYQEALDYYRGFSDTTYIVDSKEVNMTKTSLRKKIQSLYGFDIQDPTSARAFYASIQGRLSGYPQCTYNGQEISQAQAETVMQGSPAPAGLSQNVYEWRPDRLPCDCSGDFTINSPINEKDPLLCLSG